MALGKHGSDFVTRKVVRRAASQLSETARLALKLSASTDFAH
jgi:hypothetical protein